MSYAEIVRSGKGGQGPSSWPTPPRPNNDLRYANKKSVSFSDREYLTNGLQIGGHHFIGGPSHVQDSGSSPGRTGNQQPEASGKHPKGPCLKATCRPGPNQQPAGLYNRCLATSSLAGEPTTAESSRGKGHNIVNKFVSRNASRGFGKRTLRALDLFSGTGSVGNQLSKWGFQVTSLDNNPNCKATLCADILGWDFRGQYPPGYFR